MVHSLVRGNWGFVLDKTVQHCGNTSAWET